MTLAGHGIWANTPGLIEAFRALYECELSYSEIARSLNERFGTAFSRNACIGRAKRANWEQRACDLAHRGGNKNQIKKPKLPREKKSGFELFGFDGRGCGSRAQRIARRAARSKVKLEPTFFPDQSDAIPVQQRKQLFELENCHCRFAFNDVGDHNFFFCGSPDADLAGGKPYCPTHMDIAYDGIPPPRERKERNLRGFSAVTKIFKEPGWAAVE